MGSRRSDSCRPGLRARRSFRSTAILGIATCLCLFSVTGRCFCDCCRSCCWGQQHPESPSRLSGRGFCVCCRSCCVEQHHPESPSRLSGRGFCVCCRSCCVEQHHPESPSRLDRAAPRCAPRSQHRPLRCLRRRGGFEPAAPFSPTHRNRTTGLAPPQPRRRRGRGTAPQCGRAAASLARSRRHKVAAARADSTAPQPHRSVTAQHRTATSFRKARCLNRSASLSIGRMRIRADGEAPSFK